jgi:hypothetical protein
MSEDLIKLVQSLINSGKGDSNKLQHILDTLQQGKPLDDADSNYLQEISKESSDLAFIPSEIPVQNTDKPEETLSPQDSPDNTSREETASRFPSRKKIAAVAAIIGIVIVAYVSLDVYAVSELQFRPHHGNQYVISPTQLFIQAEVCNPSYFPAFFNKYEINAFYKSDSIEKAEISGSIISPKTYTILDGEFDLNKDVVMKLQQENIQFDPSQAHITTTVYAPIFGVIPFSVVKEYGGDQFQQVLKNGTYDAFSCA